MKKLIGTITMNPGDLYAEAADKMDELRRERDAARAEADQLRPVATAALHLSAAWGGAKQADAGAFGAHLDALWAACDKYEAAQ